MKFAPQVLDHYPLTLPKEAENTSNAIAMVPKIKLLDI